MLYDVMLKDHTYIENMLKIFAFLSQLSFYLNGVNIKINKGIYVY
jgi:hypothetical protein